MSKDTLKILEELIADGKAAERKLKELTEVTYSIGDRFKYKENKYILVMSNSRDCVMVGLKDGFYWSLSFEAEDRRAITRKELGCYDLTRYWDSQKKVLLNEDERSK